MHGQTHIYTHAQGLANTCIALVPSLAPSSLDRLRTSSRSQRTRMSTSTSIKSVLISSLNPCICTHIHTYANNRKSPLYLHLYMHIHVHVHIRGAYTSAHISHNVHIRVHTHTHTHTYTRTHLSHTFLALLPRRLATQSHLHRSFLPLDGRAH